MMQRLSSLLLGELAAPPSLGSGGYSPRGTRETGRLNSPSATSIEGLPAVLSEDELNQPDVRLMDQVDGDETWPAGRGREIDPCRGDIIAPSSLTVGSGLVL